MKHDKNEQRAKELAARLVDEMKAEGEVVDQYVGRSPEKQEELDAKAEAVEARQLDQESSKTDRERELEAELLALRREKEALDTEFQRKKAAWMDGDFSKYPPSHPFRVLIQSSHDLATNLPVEIAINGHKKEYPRGEWVEMTRGEVEVLEHAEVRAVQPIVVDGHPKQIPIIRNRHQFTAIPLG
jgi:hypothetical protein